MPDKPIIDVIAVERDPAPPQPRAALPQPAALDPMALLQAQHELLSRSMLELERSLANVLQSLQRSFTPRPQPAPPDQDSEHA